jgi:hypothetical protein
MKTKLGTVLEDEVFKELKAKADKEGRAISEIIQDALLRYFHASPKEASVRLAAVDKLCSRPFNLSPQELAEILEEDYYEQ